MSLPFLIIPKLLLLMSIIVAICSGMNGVIFDTPTTKVVGFLLQPLLHWLIPRVLQCLTQCPQARLYCFRMPYGAVLCTLSGLHPHSLFKYINSCIRISVIMYRMTARAFPTTNCKIFHKWIFIPTTRASLTTRI